MLADNCPSRTSPDVPGGVCQIGHRRKSAREVKNMPTWTQPEWLRERNNDSYGTPSKHPFWETVEFVKVGTWKVFERDGTWYGYDTKNNSWWHFQTQGEAMSH